MITADLLVKTAAWFAVSLAASMAFIRLIQYKNPPPVGWITGLLGLAFLAFVALDFGDSTLFNDPWTNLALSALGFFAVVAYFALEPHIYKGKEERDFLPHLPTEKHPTEV